MNNISLNLIVLRCADLERAALFYMRLGLVFARHRHGAKGVEHLAAELDGGGVFELYPFVEGGGSTLGTRVGFLVGSVDGVIAALAGEFPGAVISAAKDSEWGRRAVLVDTEGHKVEILEK